MTGSVRARVGDLAQSDAAAVVRSVRSDGEAITAVGRRLERLAGAAVARRLQGLGDLPVGGAVITPAGELPAQFIIHVVLQSAEEPVTPQTVQRALVNALRRARDLGLETVAFPPVGSGAGNLDSEVAADLLVEVLTTHLRDGDAPGLRDLRRERLRGRAVRTRHLVEGPGRGRSLRTRRRLLGSAIVVVWLAIVGAHARREYFQPGSSRLAEAALALKPGDHLLHAAHG